jgi:putative transposase
MGHQTCGAVGHTVDRRFDAACRDTVRVWDITYVNTLKGWLCLTVVIELFSPCVVGWSMQSRVITDPML